MCSFSFIKSHIVWFVGLPFRRGVGGGRGGQDVFDILFKCL